MPDGPEEALLLAAGRGDRRAFEALYQRFAKPLMAFLTTLAGDATEAQDLVQETFVRAWRAAPRWEPRGRASTWLFTIARHAASNWRAGRSVRRAAEAQAQARTTMGPATPIDLPAALAQAVEGLSEPLRTVFVLARLHGRTLSEVAVIEGVPEGTVKSRLSAAEAALRKALASHVRGRPGER